MSVVHIPFRKGMDEGVDPRQAEPGTLTLLKNGYFLRGGEIRKRNGMTAFSALARDGSAVTLSQVFSRGDALCGVGVVGGDGVKRVLTYSESEARWVPTERAPEFSAEWTSPVDSHESVSNPDVAYVGGLLVLVWRTGGSLPTDIGPLYFCIIEVASGNVVVPPELITSTAQFQAVVVAGTRVVIAWRDNAAGGALRAFNFTTAPFAANAIATVAAGPLLGEGPFDVAVFSDNRLGWAYTLGGDVQVLSTDSALAVVGGPWNLGAPGVTSRIGVSAYSDRYLHVVYRDTAGPTNRFAVFNVAGGVLVGDAALAVALTGIGNGTANQAPLACLAVSANQAIVVCGRIAAVRDASTGLAVGNAVIVDGPVVGRPFLAASGRYYCVAAVQRDTVTESVPVASPLLVELPLPNATGVDLPCFSAASPAPRQWGDASHVAHVVTDGVSHWFVSSVAITPFSLAVYRQKQGMVLTKLTPSLAKTVTVLGGLAVSSGAQPWWFDGVCVGDVGFTTHAPVLAVAAGGGLTVGGTYLVGLIYERYDALGNLHRSALTYASITPTAGNQSVNVDQWYLSATAKQRSARALLNNPTYIAVSLTANGGSLFYRQSVPGTLLTANNSTAGGFATVNLTAVLTGGQYALEYTTGGVLPDNPPPGFLDIAVHRDRVWGVAGDRRSIWFSKKMGDYPKVFPGFHESQVLRAEGDVVALASHEGMLLVLGETSLWLVDGEGPPPVGYPTDLSPPRRLSSDVGCMTPHSVVSTSGGTFFQGSDARIYRIHGALVGHVGKAVEDDILAYPVVTAAVLVEKRSQVRFTCMNAALTAGIVLVYDMVFNQWSRFEYHDRAVHGCYWRGKYVAVLGTEAYVEDEATFYDAVTNWVYLELVTAWISFTSPTGWQRVRRVEVLGEYRGPHKFYLELSCDYSASWLQSCLFDEAATLVNQGRVTAHVGSQSGMSPRNRAIRLRLRDDPRAYVVGETGEAVRWSGIGLDVLQQEGVARHGAAKAKV